MYKADISYYPSYIERDAIHQIDQSIRVKAITAYVYEEFLKNINKDFARREGLLFVGGFAHPPNADAVLWFAREIYPRIREKDVYKRQINDCSTDRTLAICRENGFHVVNLPINLGIGGAVQTLSLIHI